MYHLLWYTFALVLRLSVPSAYISGGIRSAVTLGDADSPYVEHQLLLDPVILRGHSFSVLDYGHTVPVVYKVRDIGALLLYDLSAVKPALRAVCIGLPLFGYEFELHLPLKASYLARLFK